MALALRTATEHQEHQSIVPWSALFPFRHGPGGVAHGPWAVEVWLAAKEEKNGSSPPSQPVSGVSGEGQMIMDRANGLSRGRRPLRISPPATDPVAHVESQLLGKELGKRY